MGGLLSLIYVRSAHYGMTVRQKGDSAVGVVSTQRRYGYERSELFAVCECAGGSGA